MSGHSGLCCSGLLLVLAATAGGWAAEETAPGDPELLEFLGSWEEEDDDWLAVIIEDEASQSGEQADMAPVGAEAEALADED